MQAARAGNTITALLLYRRKVNREELKPVSTAAFWGFCGWRSMFAKRLEGNGDAMKSHISEKNLIWGKSEI